MSSDLASRVERKADIRNKKKLDGKVGEAEGIGQTEEQAPEVQGQRKQPKKKKKKR